MHNFSQEEIKTILEGDDKYGPFIDFKTVEKTDLEDKEKMKLLKKEFERIYANWKYFLFEKKVGYFSARTPFNQKLLAKFVTFCVSNSVHPLDILMYLNEKSLANKINKDAFHGLPYITNENVLNSYLEYKLSQKKNKIENSYASFKQNDNINTLIKNVLTSKSFDSMLLTDRYIQTLIAVLKDMRAGKRINVSSNIKSMCEVLLKENKVMELIQ